MFYQRWWDLRSRKIMETITFSNPITSMELSSQMEQLVVTSGNTVALIPQIPNGPLTRVITLPYCPSSASIHPTHQDRFVTGSLTDEWVRVHSMSGEERDVLKGHHGPVHCVEFSPDGEMYASGSGEFSSLAVLTELCVLSHVILQRMVGDVHSILNPSSYLCHRNYSSVANHTWQDIWIMERAKRVLSL